MNLNYDNNTQKKRTAFPSVVESQHKDSCLALTKKAPEAVAHGRTVLCFLLVLLVN